MILTTVLTTALAAPRVTAIARLDTPECVVTHDVLTQTYHEADFDREKAEALTTFTFSTAPLGRLLTARECCWTRDATWIGWQVVPGVAPTSYGALCAFGPPPGKLPFWTALRTATLRQLEAEERRAAAERRSAERDELNAHRRALRATPSP